MVAYCVAYNCTTLQDKTKGVPFHCFPFGRPEICKLWIQAVRRENWTPTKSSKLCGHHFQPSDYKFTLTQLTGKSILKHDAVPSIFDYSRQKHPKRDKSDPRWKFYKRINESDDFNIKPIPMNAKVDLTSASTAEINKVVEGRTQTRLDHTVDILHKQVNTLQELFESGNVEISDLADENDVFEMKHEPTDEEFDAYSTSTSSRIKILLDNGTQTESPYREDILLRKIKTLKQTVKRRDEKILKLMNIIKEFSKREFSDESLDTVHKKQLLGEEETILVKFV